MTVSMEARLQLIRAFPCFTQFSVEQYKELAVLMQDKTCQPHEVIVTENDLIDSVYIIVSGEAEVTRTVTHRKKSLQSPVAVLHSGEAIGLNDTGFYSKTGKRTATVTALTEMLLLRLDIKDLYGFLKKHNLELSMYAASAQMLRMRLIKQSLPFGKISHERLQWLAERVEEISLPANSILFNEGDKGDKCYLIRSGKIEVIAHEEGKEHQLAVLKPPVLFGEATLITHAPRNATARVVEDAELLVLKHELLTELIESEDAVSNMFMTLMLDRSRPMKNEHVTVHQRTAADGQELTILKNPDNGAYFKLSNEGYYIWQHLDGKHTMQDITIGMADEFQLFAPNVVAGLISKLTKAGFVSNVDIAMETGKSRQSFWIKLLSSTIRLLDFRIALGDADAWVTVTYQKFVRYFFTPLGKWLMFIFAITGFIALAVSTHTILAFFNAHKISLLLVLIIYPLSLLDLMLHELAHAYAVKAAGREVHYIGVGWMYSGPVAFTDTSDMWLSPRRERMVVNLAGVYADAMFAALCGFLIFIIPNTYVQSLLWIMAIFTYVGALRQLNPLQEYDGYYVLMDWVEKNRLRQHAVLWLVKKLPKCLRHPSLFKKNKPEIYYWLACIAYIVIVSIITLLLQFFVLKALGIQSKNPYLMLLLPLAVAIFSAIGIIVEIKNQAEE